MHYARMMGHDYREGYYFVTINTAPRRNCLSRIAGGKVELLPFEEERAAEVSHYLELAQGGATLIGVDGTDSGKPDKTSVLLSARRLTATP